jgi:hypothetical protein
MKTLRWILLGGYIFCMFMFVITSCGKRTVEQDLKDDVYYRDFDLKIVSINDRVNNGRSGPQLCNVILFETTYYFEQRNGTEHLYRELIVCDTDKSCGCEKKIKIDTEWLYNHKPGDLVHFDYMLKSKFFKIKR